MAPDDRVRRLGLTSENCQHLRGLIEKEEPEKEPDKKKFQSIRGNYRSQEMTKAKINQLCQTLLRSDIYSLDLTAE